jgi:hypothetical protein
MATGNAHKGGLVFDTVRTPINSVEVFNLAQIIYVLGLTLLVAVEAVGLLIAVMAVAVRP